MKIFNFKFKNFIRVGAIIDGKFVDLVVTSERQSLDFKYQTLDKMVHDWQKASDIAAEIILKASASGNLSEIKGSPEFLPPLRKPGTFRDFYAFEKHVSNARKLRGLEVAPEWYKMAIFYFSNPNSIHGNNDLIKFPDESVNRDYELEVGAVLGYGGKNLTPDEGEKLIAGYCVLNDWSARDIQRQEMAVGLGPAKGKDFATSIGPWLVTPDELEDRRHGKGFELKMTAEVNGEIMSEGNWSSIHFSFGEMISRASRDVQLFPGELIGSGTVGNGCLLERGLDHDLWLKSGDRVVLEIERLGVLKNIIE